MKADWKFIAPCLLALTAIFMPKAFAQEPAEKFKEWLPKMTAQDLANDEQVKAMEEAQQGWMSLCLQNQDSRETTNKLMLEALGQDLPVITKAWLLHILGWVGNDECVDTIAKFLPSEEEPLFDESARALAHIATDKAIAALKAAQADSKTPEKFNSYINAPKVDLSVGVESELPLALPVISKADYDAYMAKFNDLDNDAKARALGSLRVTKDKKYVDLAVAALASDNDDVKKAALLALEKIASAKQFDALYDMLGKYDRGFVVRVMRNVPGADFDEAVAKAIATNKDKDNLASLAEIASGRYLTSVVGTLLDAAKKDDCPARLQLLAAAEVLASKDNIGEFVDASLAFKAGAERDRAEQIIARLCEGDAAPVIAKMNNQNGPQIFLLLGRIGGPAALKQLEAGLGAKDPQMVALSIRALCNWPDATVYEKLLAIAKDKNVPEQLRIQALRAFIRVVSLPDEQDGIDMSGADKLANLKTAFELATRDDERNLVLERVGAVRELDSVRFALEKVDDPKLQNKALGAILDLAHQDYLRKKDKDLFRKALDVVLEKGDKGQKDRAGNYKSNIR